MKILKSKQIRIQITLLASFAIIISVALCYFLGWSFEVTSFLIAFGILVCLLSIIWLICLALIKFEKEYFVIDTDRITLWRKDELKCELKKADIIEMQYLCFKWAFLMQMGSGYLSIICPIEALKDEKFASIIMPDGTAVFEISMSKQQAKAVAKILEKEVTIK